VLGRWFSRICQFYRSKQVWLPSKNTSNQNTAAQAVHSPACAAIKFYIPPSIGLRAATNLDREASACTPIKFDYIGLTQSPIAMVPQF